MSEIIFVLDAGALARKFYDDIGKRNLDIIFSYPNSTFYTPHIGIIETCSTLLSACNAGLIDYSEYEAVKSTLNSMIEKKELNVITMTEDFVDEAISTLEKYKRQPGKSFNGIDSIYIILSRNIAEKLNGTGAKIIFVTSDGKLYNAAMDEKLFGVFHFWTCNFGCGCTTFIPSKEKKDRPPRFKKCNVCGNDIEIKQKYTSPNTCPTCGIHCAECRYDLCTSTYDPHFN